MIERRAQYLAAARARNKSAASATPGGPPHAAYVIMRSASIPRLRTIAERAF
jgi:hypothetical protein